MAENGTTTENGMVYRSLGRCGTKVSAFGLGGWTTFGESVRDLEQAGEIIRMAFEAGINFFDIADVYACGESERVMGQALAEFPRHELVISSKVFFPMSDDVNDRGLSRKHIIESIERSLNNIGTDYLDIYFCHRFDEQTPIEETARAMDDLIRQGMILYWGTSEWTGAQLREAHRICDRHHLYRPQVEQPQYNLIWRDKFERDVLPAADALGMGAVVWSPLASGLLTGKYDRAVPEGTRLARIDWLREKLYTPEHLAWSARLEEPARRLGCTRAQLALAWAVSRPGVSSVILGATRTSQLTENLAALHLNLPADVVEMLEAQPD